MRKIRKRQGEKKIKEIKIDMGKEIERKKEQRKSRKRKRECNKDKMKEIKTQSKIKTK